MEARSAFSAALRLVVELDSGFLDIVGLWLRVTCSAVVLAALIGMPLGALLALSRFPGRSLVIISINALMGSLRLCLLRALPIL